MSITPYTRLSFTCLHCCPEPRCGSTVCLQKLPPGCPQMLLCPLVSVPHLFSLFFSARLQTGSCALHTAPPKTPLNSPLSDFSHQCISSLTPPVNFYSCSKAQLRWPFFLAAQHRGSPPSVLPLLDSQALLFPNIKILCQAWVCFSASSV